MKQFYELYKDEEKVSPLVTQQSVEKVQQKLGFFT